MLPSRIAIHSGVDEEVMAITSSSSDGELSCAWRNRTRARGGAGSGICGRTVSTAGGWGMVTNCGVGMSTGYCLPLMLARFRRGLW